jgi:anion-transporting  ArsA/GET3 family ATPase
MRSLTASRVVFVSGKGGVGKTTVAAAIALAAARSGRRVLLCEVEQRDALAPLFGREHLRYEERILEPNLRGMSIDPDESLIEYLRHFYGIPRISRALVTSRAVEFATQIAPGLRDILLVGKVKEAEVRRGVDGRPVYDLIVVDAPPTGRLARFLDAPRAITALVSSGPVARQAKGVLDVTTNPARCHVVLVTVPEELPIRETMEARAAVAEIGVRCGPVICNQLWPSAPQLADVAEVEAALAEHAGTSPGDAKVIAENVARSAVRAQQQQDALATLEAELGEPAIPLPFLFTAELSRSDLDVLARRLDASGRLR